MELYDLTIIGGGPAGLYAAFYSGMRDMKTKLIEARGELGGRVLVYPEKMIWDVGGLDPIRGEQLIRQLIRQAQTFEPTIVLSQQIVGLERLRDGTMIVTADTGQRHHTRTLLLAVGGGVLQFAKLEIEGAERYELTNLHYTVTEMERFRGKRVLISGGGDSAVDWANALEPVAASVTLVHRRDSFGGHERQVKQMRESTVKVRTPHMITQLHGNGDRLHSVTIATLDPEGHMTEPGERIEVDDVIVSHGRSSDFGPMAQWGLKLREWDFQVDETLATGLAGVFAAGDAVHYPSKLRLIAGAFTDAALAVNSAKLYLEPDAVKQAYVSSHNDKFMEKNKSLLT